MTGRKRSRDELEDETITDHPPLTQRQILEGLNNLWHNGSIETFNALIDQLHDINTIYGYGETRQRIEKDRRAIRRSTALKTLQDVAERELETDDTIKIKLPRFEPHVIISNDSNFTSMLQHRYRQFLQLGSPAGVRSLVKNVRRYYLLVAMQEHEMEHGPMDEDYSITMVGNSCWTPAEKRKFFMAVERCSRGDVSEISRRLGPTKTVAEVGAYLNLLDAAARAIGKCDQDETYTAREMSDLFLMQENRMAMLLESKLETESFAKHQDLINQEIVQKSMELFEIWNFSSLTRIFAGINDMTVLSSSLVQYYQLVKQFVADIITGVYTELLDSDDKTVSRSMMNHIIAKRKNTWTNLNNEKDVRLKNLDIMAMIDGRQRFHRPFSEYRSASFLAKKRRMGWKTSESIDKDQEEIHKIIEIDSGSESDDPDRGENGSDYSDDSDNDDMLKPFDQEDELVGQYIIQDDRRQHLFEDAHVKLYETIDTFEEEEEEEEGQEEEEEIQSEIEDEEDVENDDEDEDEGDVENDDEDEEEEEDEDNEELVEERMQELDKSHEKELIQHLEFHNVESILSHQNQKN